MINLLEIEPDSPYAEMVEKWNEHQKRWYSLTPEQQEAERRKYAVYDARIADEDNRDDENESPE